jgi:hypothetical protein
MHMPMMAGSHHGRGWADPYVRTYQGEGTRIVMWHMWPMVLFGWMLFMLGMVMGAKKGMMAGMMGGRMGAMGGQGECGGGGKMGMMGGMGMRKAMMQHHHHGQGGPCCEPHGGQQYEREQDRPEGGG